MTPLPLCIEIHTNSTKINRFIAKKAVFAGFSDWHIIATKVCSNNPMKIMKNSEKVQTEDSTSEKGLRENQRIQELMIEIAVWGSLIFMYVL